MVLNAAMSLLPKREGLQGAAWEMVESDGTVVAGAVGVKDAPAER